MEALPPVQAVVATVAPMPAAGLAIALIAPLLLAIRATWRPAPSPRRGTAREARGVRKDRPVVWPAPLPLQSPPSVSGVLMTRVVTLTGDRPTAFLAGLASRAGPVPGAEPRRAPGRAPPTFPRRQRPRTLGDASPGGSV